MNKTTKPSAPRKHGGRKKNAKRLIRAARFYIDCGWKVFLVAPGTRVPFAETNGSLDATDDLGVIRRLAKERPNANLAIATGMTSGIVVLDIDRHGGDGFETLEGLEDRYGKLPGHFDVEDCRRRRTPGVSMQQSHPQFGEHVGTANRCAR